MKTLIILIIILLLTSCSSNPVDVDEDPFIEITESSGLNAALSDSSSEVVFKDDSSYTVQYVLGYNNLTEEESKEANSVIELMQPTREGYRFEGWFLDEFLTKPIYRILTITDDIIVYAKWIEDIKEPYELVFDDIRSLFPFDFESAHPIDYQVSPSSNDKKADTIYNGIYLAAGVFEKYLEGFANMSVIVLHPNDRLFYEELYEPLDLITYEDIWFERTSIDGGAKVHQSNNGRPHMFFMIPDSDWPDSRDIDVYVHETMHIFQISSLDGKSDINLGCMFSEGGATLMGNILGRVDERQAYYYFIDVRNSRINLLNEYYKNEENLPKALFDQIVFGQNDRCNGREPRFGYNLGVLVAEKMVHDFGIENFMDMHLYFNDYRIDEIFVMNFKTDYETWVEEAVVPYIINLISF